MYARDINFELYAKTNKERDMWVEAFCRAIENKHKTNAAYWAEESKFFADAKRDWEQKKDKQRPSRLSRAIEVTVDGMQEFKSANLFFNCVQFEGYAMKKINNKKVYHSKPFHKKYFRIVYASSSIAVFNQKEDS